MLKATQFSIFKMAAFWCVVLDFNAFLDVFFRFHIEMTNLGEKAKKFTNDQTLVQQNQITKGVILPSFYRII